MSLSIRPKYYQVGTDGKYALYPVTTEKDEEAPATFSFDNLNLDEVKLEYEDNEARMDVEEAEVADEQDN